MLRPLFVGSVVLVAAVASVVGCSDGEKTKKCEVYVVPPETDLTKPETQLRRDVLPILSKTCGLPSCHGGSGHNNGVYLGGDPERLYASAVNKPAEELPAMSYVAAGDPANSYLLHKIDGDNCTLRAQCTDGDCGSTMPEGFDLLAITKRDTIRRWVAQGAKND
jgi:hypothetical protein